MFKYYTKEDRHDAAAQTHNAQRFQKESNHHLFFLPRSAQVNVHLIFLPLSKLTQNFSSQQTTEQQRAQNRKASTNPPLLLWVWICPTLDKNVGCHPITLYYAFVNSVTLYFKIVLFKHCYCSNLNSKLPFYAPEQHLDYKVHHCQGLLISLNLLKIFNVGWSLAPCAFSPLPC